MSWSSGTNTIKEGSESKSLTLQILELKKQGGGTEYFVRKSDVTLGTKSVTQNGTYTAAADDKYGFSQFSVNVRGGNGSADSHGKPTGGDIKPGGAGSAVVGTDPETGNDIVVGVDEAGKLVQTPIPTSIVLVTPPTKTDYNDGESIDLSGAVVVAKMADGTTWTDADHPNGHVSCSCDPAAADASQVSGESASSEVFPEIGDVPVAEIGLGEYVTHGGAQKHKFILASKTDSVYALNRYIEPDGNYAYIPLICSKSDFSISVYTSNWDGTWKPKSAWDYFRSEVEGKVCCFAVSNVFGYVDGYYDGIPNISSVPAAYRLAYIILYGNRSGGGQEITLNWARPGDGKVLSTTMEINVGAHTTESSSGTSGSGGGGSF